MSEEHEIQVVYVLAECFYFFARHIKPDINNAPQHYINLAKECEKGLKLLGASIKQEAILGNPIVKYKGREIKSSTSLL